MEYKRFQDTVLLRLDPEEEVCASVLKVAELENIKLAEVSGIGAAKQFTIGVFVPSEKRYYAKSCEGDYEITSLLGNLTTKEGKPYLHLHMNAGGLDGQAVGGHLNSAVIGVTAEIVIRCIDGGVDRKMHPDIGVNQIIF